MTATEVLRQQYPHRHVRTVRRGADLAVAAGVNIGVYGSESDGWRGDLSWCEPDYSVLKLEVSGYGATPRAALDRLLENARRYLHPDITAGPLAVVFGDVR